MPQWAVWPGNPFYSPKNSRSPVRAPFVHHTVV